MEQRVRYCKTSDGFDIAYATYGAGLPIVIPPNIMNTHLQAELDLQLRVRSFLERLAQRLLVIRYDGRGTGMSQRDVVDFSAEAGERDLLAVLDRLEVDRFALYNHLLAGPAPAAFAARHPDRVSCLVWWVGQTVGISPELLRQFQALEGLIDSEWDLYCHVAGRLVCGWDSPEAAAATELIRAGASPATRRAANRELLRAREENFANFERIEAPTLVTHTAGVPFSADRARTIALAIPNAHLVAIPGHPNNLNAVHDDNPVLTTAIADFVEATADPGAPGEPPALQLGAMRAILWTDVVDHTRLMDRYGDAKGRDLLREHERITREGLAEHGGTEVKAMGDGFMSWFSSAQRALDCAIALQRAFGARNASTAEPLHVRAGLNAGEPIVEDDDLFGTAVIAAARICHEAGGDEIVVSDVVRQLVTGKGFSFTDRGVVTLKGFGEPVRLSTVRWQE